MLVQFSTVAGHQRIIYGCGRLPQAGAVAVYTADDGSVIHTQVLEASLVPPGVWAGPQRIKIGGNHPAPAPGSSMSFFAADETKQSPEPMLSGAA